MACASLLDGCSCNAPNSLDQYYCQSYPASITPWAIGSLVGFVALAIASVWLFRRFYRPSSPPPPPAASAAADSLPAASADGVRWRIAGLRTRPASEVLAELNGTGPPVARINEGYDGRWMVEIALPTLAPPLDFIGTWTTHEQACRDALNVLEARGLLVEAAGT